MNIEVRTDNHIENSARLIEFVREHLTSEFSYQSERIHHLEVHLSDAKGDKKGDHETNCMIEARANGMHPVAVKHHAANIDLALGGAVEKLHHSLDHAFDKLKGDRHIPRPEWQEIDS